MDCGKTVDASGEPGQLPPTATLAIKKNGALCLKVAGLTWLLFTVW